MSAITGWLDGIEGPHRGQLIATAGASLEEASAAVIMLHGRGATATGMLDLAELIHVPGVAYLAPQANRNTWYPYSFLETRENNEPGLSSAHAAVARMIERLSAAGVAPERIVLLGFSQGACLASDHAALNPRRYGGIIALSGGLIGDQLDPDGYTGSLKGTPALLGCSDIDPHIPVGRVHESAEILERLEAAVTTRIYPGMGHTINQDEIDHARSIVADLVAL